jgi:hypothetical protein
MKRLMIIAAAMMLSGSAMAQAVVEIAPEQRSVIKQYVTTHKVAPARVKERVVVGATIPQDVELAPVPSDWGPSFSRYRYIYTGDDVVLVDPGTRKVIQVID